MYIHAIFPAPRHQDYPRPPPAEESGHEHFLPCDSSMAYNSQVEHKNQFCSMERNPLDQEFVSEAKAHVYGLDIRLVNSLSGGLHIG